MGPAEAAGQKISEPNAMQSQYTTYQHHVGLPPNVLLMILLLFLPKCFETKSVDHNGVKRSPKKQINRSVVGIAATYKSFEIGRGGYFGHWWAIH